MPLTIIHAADLHLGAKFSGMGEKGVLQRRRLRESVADIVDYTLQENADALLLAGDTFDTTWPSPESLDAMTRGVQRLAAAGIPVLLISGTHDAWLPESAMVTWAAQQANVVLLSPEKPTWCDPKKGFCVHGVSLLSALEPKNPLQMLPEAKTGFINIGMVHAALAMGRENPQEAVITPGEIASCKMDYLALGHWHRRRDCSQGNTVAWYPGSPEMIAIDENEPGVVLKVCFSIDAAPIVEAHRIGRRSTVELTLREYTPEEVIKKALAHQDPDKVLLLRLQGIIPPETYPDLKEITEALNAAFFHVKIKNEYSLAVSEATMAEYSDQTVAGRFIRLVQEEKQQAGEDKRALEELDQSLQLGLALLAGREVPPCF